MWIVEGLEGGNRFAVITKVHHCMIDGMSSVDLLEVLLTPQPTETIEPAPRWIPRRPRARATCSGRGGAPREHTLRAGARLPPLPRRGRGSALRLRTMLRAVRDTVRATLRQVSDTPLNKPVGPHRASSGSPWTWRR